MIINFEPLITDIKSTPDDFYGIGNDGVVYRHTRDSKFEEYVFKDNSRGNCAVSRNFIAFCNSNKHQLSIFKFQDKSISKYIFHASNLCISPDETLLAGIHDDYVCRVWDLTSKQDIASYKGHTVNVACFVFSVSSSEIFSGDYNGFIHKWDAKTGRLIAKSEDLNGSCLKIAVSAQLGAVSSGLFIESTVTVFCTDTLQLLYDVNSSDKFAISFDGAYLAFVSHYDKEEVILWDLPNNQKIIIALRNRVCSLSFALDGRLAVYARDKTISIYENINLSVFLLRRELDTAHMKTVQSFFYAVRFNLDSDFNDSDKDNYLLMRILDEMT